MRLVDAHAHLQADRFGRDHRAVVDRARAAGVERILVPGWDVDSSRAAVALAHDLSLDAAVGVHPHAADGLDDDGWAEIRALAADPLVVAIGETGLDYDRAFSRRTAQLAGLRRHVELAAEAGKPLIVHCRSRPGENDAQQDVIEELRDAHLARPVLHSFSGSLDYAERALDLGAVVSFSGLVFRAGEEASADVARLAAPDRILVETDSPYLSAPGAPTGRNEPSWVGIVARWLGERRGLDHDALGEMLVANYDRTFGKTDE